MKEEYSDISDLNYLGLTVPVDGALAIVADGCRTWAPGPADKSEVAVDLAMGRDTAGERWVPMCYEAVTTADCKIIDVVAWDDNDPSRWWLRTGRGVVLGAEELARVSWTDLPCFIVSTPAGWRFLQQAPRQLQSICILDCTTANTSDLFDACFGTIICASPDLERRLQARALECGGSKLNTGIDDLG